MVLNYLRSAAQDRKTRAIRRRKFRPTLELLEDRALPSGNPALGNIFYIEMENHNLTQPSGLGGSPEQLLGNPAAPYLDSLMTPGNANAANTSYASNYYNAAPGIHPSEPNYVWQEAGLAGPLNDKDPFPKNIVDAPNLSALLQAAGIPWKSYQEDVDLLPTKGSVNQPGKDALTSTVAPQSEWTVPLDSFSGTSSAYTNAYNGSNQYNFACKHDGQLFFLATNGGDNHHPSNPESLYYAPLQHLQTDLNSNTVASYNLITPDQYNDMHSSLANGFTYQGTNYTGDQAAIAEGDNFLSIVVPQIMASKAYQNNGAIVIWFDETEVGDTTQYTLPLVVISPLAKGNAYDSTLTYTHSSDLKSIEELFGVYAPGGGFLGDANTPGTNDLSDLFQSGALTHSTLQGLGSLQSSDLALSRLIVTLTWVDSVTSQAVNFTTTTSHAGSSSFAGLVPGTFTRTIMPTQGLQNDSLVSASAKDAAAAGAAQALGGPDFSFQVPGSAGLLHQDDLAIGNLFHHI
jgi:hypothetical protein